jgi:sugar O-acyltransferase (sialic acid O-acetyltransferase NeuD family)
VRKKISVAVAIADPSIRKTILSRIQNNFTDFPVLIDPSAKIGSPSNVFNRGTLITAGVILTTGIALHEFVIINLSSTIGHDVSVGAFSSVMPGCHISGNVKIGEGVLLGTGSVILQNLTIGSNTKIGAGAVVTKPIADNVVAVGVPARKKS